MVKPNIISTRKPLPFNELSPLEFERMCLWLIEREGYLGPQHFGEAGSEQGRDIVAYKLTGEGKEVWYFQCKRYQEISAASLKAEVNKYSKLRIAEPAKRAAGIVFITSATLSARTREDVSIYCQAHGYESEFWARTELDMLVKKYPEIVEEFFYASTTPIVTALHQLPPPPSDFTGRKDEIDEFLRVIEHGSASIVGIHGLGGVGKTALALKLARQLTTRYPRAQFYIDMKGTSKTPLSIAEAMSYVIRAFFSKEALPKNEAELSALYRSVLY